MIHFTELENLPVYDVRGEFLGKLTDLVVDPAHNALRVAAYYVRTLKHDTLCISYEQIQALSIRAVQTSVPAGAIRCYAPDESLMSVKKDVLDQQVIDVNHRKVVRVNDVDFDIQPTNGHTELRVMAANVGLSSALRRLLQGLLAKHRIRAFTSLFPSKTIPWEFVNLIEPDPSRRVKLRISFDRLAELHPADIADILEELSRDEQKAVIESLDEETAAHAISEIPTRMQAVLLESIPADKAADIVEEMAPDEAADVLQELPPETSAEVLAVMETDEAREVRELLGFEEKTAGALMTTEVFEVSETATLQQAIQTLRAFDGPPEAVHELFLVDADQRLAGVVPLARILLADSSVPLKTLERDPLISVQPHASDKEVIDLFHKYNLVALPVVDEAGRLLGVVTADDVLELVLKRK